MKCYNCLYCAGESASMEYPYPVEYCSKGHWEGGSNSDKENHAWDDCKDFKENSNEISKTIN